MKTSRAVVMLISFLLLFSFPHVISMEKKELRVAIYFSTIKRYARDIEECVNYSWVKGNVEYVIKARIIGKDEVMNGNLSNYDAFIISASGRSYMDAYNPVWRENVKKFIRQGGGYIGICGGANVVSMGFNESIISPNEIFDLSTLKIVNVYVNDQQDEEWQYLWKSNWQYGGVPVKMYILNSSIPIFDGFYGEYRSIRYWGGPGMYDAHLNGSYGNVIPLAVYGEEPSEVAPLHYWRFEHGRWVPLRNITTDIKGQYAVVASFYGNGRLVIFGPHPEANTFFDGHVREFPVRNTRFTWFIYDWVTNNSSVVSYNWWMVRRSIAWVCGLERNEMPYISEIAGYVKEPKYGIYMNGRKVYPAQNAVVIGSFILHAQIIDANNGEIKVDGRKIYEGNGDISIDMNLSPGKHAVYVMAENEHERAWSSIQIYSL